MGWLIDPPMSHFKIGHSMQGFGMLLASVLALLLVHMGISLEASASEKQCPKGRNNDIDLIVIHNYTYSIYWLVV